MDKPEATPLTDKIDKQYLNKIYLEAAAELRRLHQVNQELVEALKIIFPNNLSAINKNVPDAAVIPIDFTYGELRKVAAAIAKHKEQA